MLNKAMLLTLAASCALTLVALPAQADQRWRKHRVIYPDFEIYTSSIERFVDEDAWLDDEDDEDLTVEDMRDRRKRWARENDNAWWMDEDLDDEEDMPQPVAKPVKKKKAAMSPVHKKKPAAKTVAMKKPDAAAKTATKPLANKTQTASVTPKLNSEIAPEAAPAKPVPKLAAVTPKATLPAAPSGKTIGCTAGAAVVTGLGFATVRPRVCTGETYAYMAAKADGNYAIKLKAATGEVVDVRKLP